MFLLGPFPYLPQGLEQSNRKHALFFPPFLLVSKGGGAGAIAPSRSDQDRKHVEAE